MTKALNAPKKRRHAFAPTPSPVRRDELKLQGLGIAIRSALLEDLTNFLLEDAQNRPAAEWLAYLQLSMAAFGALLDLELNKEACKRLAGRIYTDADTVWIELDGDDGIRRLVLDPITACLLHQLPKSEAGPKAMDEAMGQVLRRLIPAHAGANGYLQRRNLFLDAITAFFRRHIPGALLGHATGTLPSACVPRTTLVRESGSRLAALDTNGTLPPEQEKSPEGDSDTKRQLAPIRRALRAFQPSSSAGGQATGTLDERRGGLDAELAAIIEQNRITGVVGALVPGWLRALIRHGPSQEILETSTLKTYASPVFEFLCTKVGQGFLRADPEEVEDVFHNLIERCTSASGRQRTYLVLRHFHTHAVRSLQVEPVEWADILADIADITSRVDANLVYWHEVLAADEIIQSSKLLTPDIKLLARLYVRQMWRGGLRFGECYRQRLADISLALAQVTIRPTEHGRTKSQAGIRTVPFDRLDTLGLSLLEQTCDRARILGKGDLLTPLAVDALSPRALLPRWEIATVVNQALRLATGDPTVHAHALRHARATILVDLCSISSGRIETHADPRQTQTMLLGSPGPSRRAMHAIAQMLGQSSPDIALRVYVHHAEFRLQREATRLIPVLPHPTLAAVVSKPVAWSYKRSGTPQLDLLRAQLRIAGERQGMDFRRGIATTTVGTLPTLDTRLRPSASRISLLALHHLLQLRQRADIPTSSMASCLGTSERYIDELLSALSDQSLRLGYFRGLKTREEAWGNSLVHFENVIRSPVGLEESPVLAALEDVKDGFGDISAAKNFLRSFREEKREFHAENLDELEQILRWFSACGILPSHIGIRAPFVGGLPPPPILAACASRRGITLVDKPAGTRRAATAEIHLLNDLDSTVACMAHATFLWIVRATAHLSHTTTATDGIN